ncbi:WbqC family protein [Autumnicola musiva]|uniref:WbqC family protein n=1 Tax=Autumnicola musiva TaxID=3075589 RepID=A0ABU3D348_9FLAO|nr:WbqC family protein [Zunongwangia sp. F117]MDT0675961.1 WbqC family protein [Zunongwangia sp. F117]
MKVAIMQPYFFPYIGYFQLIAATDVFVFYDDVNFIKKGWIHRNNFLFNQSRSLVSIPLKKPSQNKKIDEILIHQENFEIWKKKFLKSIFQNYKCSPHFEEIWELINSFFSKNFTSISELSMESVKAVCSYLNIKRMFLTSSTLDYNRNQNAEEKILEINHLLKSSEYYNLSGGKHLYEGKNFKKKNISLKFMKDKGSKYPQQRKGFEANLSIIDVLMFNDIPAITNMLSNYTITE